MLDGRKLCRMDWTCGQVAIPIAPFEPAIACEAHRELEDAYRAELRLRS